MSDAIVVFAHFLARPGHEDALRSAIETAQGPVRAEEGCHVYDLHVNVENPAEMFLYERWESRAALTAHGATPHIATLRAVLADVLAGPARVTVTRLVG